jgi:DNA invertase Pin-like site-specific DNA recombinase
MVNNYAILLVRVSTMVQDYEPQLDDLKKYAKSKGYTKTHIIETKESGLIDLDKKVGTNKLFSFIQENPNYNVVFATEISRLGRRQSVLHQIKEWFIKHKIQLFVKDIGYSLLDEKGKVTIGGDMMFSMYGFFAEAEIQQKKDRFRRAKQSLMEMGYSISGKTLFGYERVNIEGGRTTLILHKENSNIVRKIFNWYNRGIDVYEKKVSIKRIAIECRKLGLPQYTHSKRNINKLLKEEGYTGEKITNNKRKNYNFQEESSDEKYFITNNKIKYPVIIDKETFILTQKRLKENNSRIDKSHKNITILSQLISCNKCKSHYSGNYRNINNRVLNTYRCSSRSKSNPCDNKQSISMTMIDSAVWGLIKTDLDTLTKVISRYNPDKEIVQLKKSLKELEQRNNEIDEEIMTLNQSFKGFSKLKNVTSGDFINSIQSKVKKLDKEKGDIDNEISRIKVNLSVRNGDLDDDYKSIKNNLETIEESKELLKKYINLFVDKIDIIVHNASYSVIRVKFKIDSFSFLPKPIKKNQLGEWDDGELDLYTNIILDKTNSQNIKLYKTTTSIQKTTNNRTILLVDTKTPKIVKRTKIDLQDLGNRENKQYFKSCSFTKLNVY